MTTIYSRRWTSWACLRPTYAILFIFIFRFTLSLRGTVVVLPSRCHCSILHLSRSLADTLLPVRHALLDMLLNLEDRFYDPYCTQSKHSTVVKSYDVEIVTVRDLTPPKSSYLFAGRIAPASVPRQGWRMYFWTLQWFETITGTEMRIDGILLTLVTDGAFSQFTAGGRTEVWSH